MTNDHPLPLTPDEEAELRHRLAAANDDRVFEFGWEADDSIRPGRAGRGTAGEPFRRPAW